MTLVCHTNSHGPPTTSKGWTTAYIRFVSSDRILVAQSDAKKKKKLCLEIIIVSIIACYNFNISEVEFYA